MDLLIKILAYIFIAYSTLSISLYLKEKLVKIFVANTKKYKLNTKKKSIHINNISIESIKNLLKITSKTKLEYIIYFFAISVLRVLPDKYNSIFCLRIIALFFLILFFIGVGRFISFRDKKLSLSSKLILYLGKLSIFFLYSTVFLQAFLQKLDNNFLFMLSILISIVYSVCFLKYIIDEFNNFIFLMFNLFFVYIFNLIITGFTFGIFYAMNESSYHLFENIVINDFNLRNFILIVNKGLKYFYTYSDILNLDSLFKSCVPFIEYIFGTSYTLTILGFFISYTVSKVFSNSIDTNSNIIEQLRGKELKITLKKDL
ncbi:hypothetical protein [Desnuesiella massiliensis]|uniref:hypothetical protein n=1 Tax=Desnuesiella massiliensis TaxID=1650662 RepID=UPI0006E39116|nr:hypothetical protein [Desnuesiella massiliensis]